MAGRPEFRLSSGRRTGRSLPREETCPISCSCGQFSRGLSPIAGPNGLHGGSLGRVKLLPGSTQHGTPSGREPQDAVRQGRVTGCSTWVREREVISVCYSDVRYFGPLGANRETGRRREVRHELRRQSRCPTESLSAESVAEILNPLFVIRSTSPEDSRSELPRARGCSSSRICARLLAGGAAS